MRIAASCWIVLTDLRSAAHTTELPPQLVESHASAPPDIFRSAHLMGQGEPARQRETEREREREREL